MPVIGLRVVRFSDGRIGVVGLGPHYVTPRHLLNVHLGSAFAACGAIVSMVELGLDSFDWVPLPPGLDFVPCIVGGRMGRTVQVTPSKTSQSEIPSPSLPSAFGGLRRVR